MKTIKIFAIGMFGMLSLNSCKDSFLEVENPTAFPLEDYYVTKAHIEESLVAAYAPLHWFDYGTSYGYNSLHFMGELMGDDMYTNGETKSDQLTLSVMNTYEMTSTNCPVSLWNDCYSGVKRSNDLIKYLDWAQAADAITDTERADYESQARLLRAFYYDLLWKFWGNIPVYFVNLEMPYLSDQLTADEAYTKIIEELEDLIANGSLKDSWPEAELGHVTKPMAYMLYAEMVMIQNDNSRYAKALGYMQNIISSGKFKLVDDYASIWLESGEWGPESIFEINYFNVNSGRSWDNRLAAGGAVFPRLCGPRDFTPNADCDVEGGWGFATLPKKSVNSFEEGDVRKAATAFDCEANGTVKAGGGGWQYTGYSVYKYIGRKGDNTDVLGSNDMGFNNNYRVYRYSETLLNAAELLLKTGGSATQAAEYVNQVRNRAGLASLSSVTQDNIIDERRHEFMGEGKRYFDLCRTGKAASVLKAANDELGTRSKDWNEDLRYLPIPQSEIDATHGGMKQNPGY